VLALASEYSVAPADAVIGVTPGARMLKGGAWSVASKKRPRMRGKRGSGSLHPTPLTIQLQAGDAIGRGYRKLRKGLYGLVPVGNDKPSEMVYEQVVSTRPRVTRRCDASHRSLEKPSVP